MLKESDNLSSHSEDLFAIVFDKTEVPDSTNLSALVRTTYDFSTGNKQYLFITFLERWDYYARNEGIKLMGKVLKLSCIDYDNKRNITHKRHYEGRLTGVTHPTRDSSDVAKTIYTLEVTKDSDSAYS